MFYAVRYTSSVSSAYKVKGLYVLFVHDVHHIVYLRIRYIEIFYHFATAGAIIQFVLVYLWRIHVANDRRRRMRHTEMMILGIVCRGGGSKMGFAIYWPSRIRLTTYNM